MRNVTINIEPTIVPNITALNPYSRIVRASIETISAGMNNAQKNLIQSLSARILNNSVGWLWSNLFIIEIMVINTDRVSVEACSNQALQCLVKLLAGIDQLPAEFPLRSYCY